MKQVYDKSVEEGLSRFEVDSIHAHKNSLGQEHINERVRDILKHHTLALIDAEIEMLNKEMSIEGKYDGAADRDHIKGHHKALTDHITYLKEQRELLDNQ